MLRSTRGPEETEALQLSNFYAFEDRATGDIVLPMTRWVGSDQHVEVGGFSRAAREIDYIGIVRAALVGERNYPTLIIEIVEMRGWAANPYVCERAGDLITTWIGDGRFVRPVQRCVDCGKWAPNPEILVLLDVLNGNEEPHHLAGFGCKADIPRPKDSTPRPKDSP